MVFLPQLRNDSHASCAAGPSYLPCPWHSFSLLMFVTALWGEAYCHLCVGRGNGLAKGESFPVKAVRDAAGVRSQLELSTETFSIMSGVGPCVCVQQRAKITFRSFSSLNRLNSLPTTQFSRQTDKHSGGQRESHVSTLQKKFSVRPWLASLASSPSGSDKQVQEDAYTADSKPFTLCGFL